MRTTLLLTLLASLSLGQIPARWTSTGTPGDSYGRDLVITDDLDGDGVGDVAIATHPPINFPGAGKVELRSSLDGSLITEIPVPPPGPHALIRFATKIALVEDHDGDGFREVAVWRGDRLRGFFSPITGAMTKSFSLQADPVTEVIGIDDINADGVPDYVTLRDASGAGQSTLLEFFDGATDLGLAVVSTPGQDGDLLLIQDLDGDGLRDIFHTSAMGSITPVATLQTVSAGTAMPIFTRTTTGALGGFPSQGDVFPGGGPELLMTSVQGTTQTFDVLDPFTLFSLATVTPPPVSPTVVGFVPLRPQAADLDRDGIDEVACTVGYEVYVYDQGGFAQTPILTLFNTGILPPFFFTTPTLHATAVIRDADGYDDLVFGYTAAITQLPTVGCFGLHGGRPYGAASGPGPTRDLDWNAFGGANQAGELRVTGATPGGPGFVLASLAADDFPVFGIDVLVDVNPAAGYVPQAINFDANGSWTFGTDLAQPAFAGVRVFVQVIDTTGAVRATRGQELVFVN